jgi:16S rRNA processing protein RimM
LEKQIWNVAELDGCEVFTDDGERLGVLRDVLPSGANDIWVVQSETPEQKEFLIPALTSVVKDVDLTGRKIIVSLPAGLKDLYEGL